MLNDIEHQVLGKYLLEYPDDMSLSDILDGIKTRVHYVTVCEAFEHIPTSRIVELIQDDIEITKAGQAMRDFNARYKDWLSEGHYGLAIGNEEVVRFLNAVFEDLIKIPGFAYQQIKIKFCDSRFYADGISRQMCDLIENKINSILSKNTEK